MAARRDNMSQFHETTMTWKFDGQHFARTVVTDETGQSSSSQTVYFHEVTAVLAEGVCKMKIQLGNTQEGLWGGTCGQLHREFSRYHESGTIDSLATQTFPCAFVAEFTFRREGHGRFIDQVTQKLVQIMTSLKVSACDYWPTPDVVIRMHYRQDGAIITEGQNLADKFYPYGEVWAPWPKA